MTRKISVVGVVAIAIAACGKIDATAPTASVSGTYALSTVNGDKLPYLAFTAPGSTTEVTADVYVFAPTGRWLDSTFIRDTDNGVVTNSVETSTGNYTVNASAIALIETGDIAPSLTGTISDSVMTLTPTGFVLVYNRR